MVAGLNRYMSYALAANEACKKLSADTPAHITPRLMAILIVLFLAPLMALIVTPLMTLLITFQIVQTTVG